MLNNLLMVSESKGNEGKKARERLHGMMMKTMKKEKPPQF